MSNPLINILHKFKSYNLDDALSDPQFNDINFTNILIAKHINSIDTLTEYRLDKIFLVITDANASLDKYKKILKNNYREFLSDLIDFNDKTGYIPHNISLENIKNSYNNI